MTIALCRPCTLTDDLWSLEMNPSRPPRPGRVHQNHRPYQGRFGFDARGRQVAQRVMREWIQCPSETLSDFQMCLEWDWPELDWACPGWDYRPVPRAAPRRKPYGSTMGCPSTNVVWPMSIGDVGSVGTIVRPSTPLHSPTPPTDSACHPTPSPPVRFTSNPQICHRRSPSIRSE